jgi:hypothetical protein
MHRKPLVGFTLSSTHVLLAKVGARDGCQYVRDGRNPYTSAELLKLKSELSESNTLSVKRFGVILAAE